MCSLWQVSLIRSDQIRLGQINFKPSIKSKHVQLTFKDTGLDYVAHVSHLNSSRTCLALGVCRPSWTFSWRRVSCLSLTMKQRNCPQDCELLFFFQHLQQNYVLTVHPSYQLPVLCHRLAPIFSLFVPFYLSIPRIPITQVLGQIHITNKSLVYIVGLQVKGLC